MRRPHIRCVRVENLVGVKPILYSLPHPFWIFRRVQVVGASHKVFQDAHDPLVVAKSSPHPETTFRGLRGILHHPTQDAWCAADTLLQQIEAPPVCYYTLDG